jgi:2-polyprenyl-3-methyl-5-hydroxy-6-metoxy-1,4-benzoquinol methylase
LSSTLTRALFSINNSAISVFYRNIRLVNINNKINILNSYISGNKVLDVGCGTGDFLYKAQQKGFTINGVEVDSDARTQSSQKLGINISSAIDETQGSFDAITLWHVLEHTKDPSQTISLLLDRLAEDGIIILALPNYNSFDATYYGKYWAGYDVPRHLFHFSKESVSFLANTHNMIIHKIQPMTFDAYYVSLLSEKYRKPSPLNYLDAFQLGFRSNRKAQHTGEFSSLIYVLKKQ